MNRAPQRIARRQPAADRRDHDADRGRRRVPVLQRQQRAAVRADLQHQGRRCPRPRGCRPSNQVRIAGTRVGIVSSLTPHQNPRTGRITAIADPEARKESRTAARRHEGDRAVGLGDRAEVPGTGKGHLARTLKAGATIPVSQTREPVDIDELFNMFDKKTRNAIQINTNNFGDGLAGRGLGLNNTIADTAPAGDQRDPGAAQPRLAADGLARAVHRARPRRLRRPLRWPKQNAALLQRPRHVLHGLGGRRALARRGDRGRPGVAANRRSHSLPYEAPFIEKATEFMRLLRPSASALRTVAPPLAHAFTVGAVNLRAATALNTELAESSQALAEFAQNPVVTPGARRLHPDARDRQPAARRARARAGQLQLLDARRSATSRACSRRTSASARSRARRSCSPRTAPTTRASPPRRRPTARRSNTKRVRQAPRSIDNNHLHYNPYPNVAGPGQPQVCEAGNENYVPGKAVIGNVPGSAARTTAKSRPANRTCSAKSTRARR